MTGGPRRGPTSRELAAASGKRVRDVIAADLDVLFCGINPSLYSAAVGHHFARPGNRFWVTLYRSGFTARLLSPYDDSGLPALGLGITNLVARASRGASDLGRDELRRGRGALERKVVRYAPRYVAILGVDAYRTAFEVKGAVVGPQEHGMGHARLWVLPNPSGLNAHYQVEDLVSFFQELRSAVARRRPGRLA